MVATALRTSPRSTEAEDQFDDGLEIDKVFCPSCSTNLVMIDHSKNIKNSISSPKGTAPIAEVPFCFGCKSHVVCNAEQVQTLIQLGASGHTRIAHKGAILVATPSNIKLKRSSKAWSASPKLTEEHELMIEYFQAASTLSTGGEEVEMALIPDDDNFYLTITPSNGKQRDGYTEPHSPLKFLTEQEISPSNACSQPPKNEARLDTVERYEHDDNRETNDSIDEIDILGTHTEDDDIDQLFDSKEAAEGLRTDETIELIHRGEKAASNEECESTRATTSVQVQMGKSAEYGRGLSAPTSSSDGSQSDGSSSEGGYDFYIPEYNVR